MTRLSNSSYSRQSHHHQQQQPLHLGQQQQQQQQQQQHGPQWLQQIHVLLHSPESHTSAPYAHHDSATSDQPGKTNGTQPYILELNEFTVPIYGYISPVFVLLTIITNCLVCIVLLKRPMRNCTNAILIAMAISDTLTGIFPLPCFVYFYTLGRYRDYVPYGWCFVYFCLIEYLPTMFHTASIWLTVTLAGQRYIYVCHPAKAKRLCTVSKTVKLIAIVYAAAFASQLCRFAEYEYKSVTVASLLEPLQNRTACVFDFTPIVEKYEHVFFNLYYWFRVVFIHIIPCISLVILNSALIQTIRSAQTRRGALFSSQQPSTTTVVLSRYIDCARVIENNSTTLMLVTVVGVFLLVELPLAVLFIIMITENTLNFEILQKDTSYSAGLFINLFILISYPFNFFIYCGMSQQFRRTFRSLFTGDVSPGDFIDPTDPQRVGRRRSSSRLRRRSRYASMISAAATALPAAEDQHQAIVMLLNDTCV